MSDAPIDSKQCVGCRGVFALDHYCKSQANKGGLSTKCRACRSAYWKSYCERHPDRIEAAQEARKARRNADKDATRQKWREYYSANRERMINNTSKWAKRNADSCRAAVARWQRKNPHIAAARESAKRAHIRRHQTTWPEPEWEDFAIKQAYQVAAMRSRLTGVKHVVDHIVPLRGKTVCGMHCIANMRVITWAENAVKGNKLIEGLLCE